MPVTEEAVLLRVDGPVATIILNRPDAGNAIDMDIATGLVCAARRCQEDETIRCVILTGMGKLFCGGGDIAAMKAANEDVSVMLNTLANTLHDAMTRLLRMSKPLVVLVNGPAAGAGLSLAICGDVVIASETAHFTAAYSSVGLTPDGGMSWLLPRHVGLRRAQEMILTNRRVAAAEAAVIGLVTHTVAAADLAAEGERTAAMLVSAATNALGAARGLLMESFGSSFEAQLARETETITRAAGGTECQEGVAAYLERRKPNFIGVM